MKLSLVQLLILLLGPVCMATAQDKVNMKFGKPTKTEMQMTTYESEPDADAVVLCRLTDVEYTIQRTGYLVDYREKIRIKVLKPSGARFAKVVIPFLKETPMDNRTSSSKMTLKVDMIDNNSLSSVEIPLLRNKDVQKKINDLALEANQKRYEAYNLEQQALQTFEFRHFLNHLHLLEQTHA